MHMEDLLARDRPVGEKQVDAGDTWITFAHSGSHLLTDDEQVGADFRWQLRQRSELLPGHHQHVSAGERSNVHERDHCLVLVHTGGLGRPGNDLGEDCVWIHNP